jgi:hypothetical protein
MSFKPPKVSTSGGYEVSQEINLKEVFGVDLSNNDDLKQLIGEAIIQTIRQRTESGKGIKFSESGDASTYAMKKYSKAYKESAEFRAFNKTDKVNLTMSGDMLGLLDIVKSTGNKIKIGWDDSEQNAKAYNHTVGDTVPERPFFGVSKSELKNIAKEFKSEIADAVDASNDGASKKEIIAKLGSLMDFIDGES